MPTDPNNTSLQVYNLKQAIIKAYNAHIPGYLSNSKLDQLNNLQTVDAIKNWLNTDIRISGAWTVNGMNITRKSTVDPWEAALVNTVNTIVPTVMVDTSPPPAIVIPNQSDAGSATGNTATKTKAQIEYEDELAWIASHPSEAIVNKYKQVFGSEPSGQMVEDYMQLAHWEGIGVALTNIEQIGSLINDMITNATGRPPKPGEANKWNQKRVLEKIFWDEMESLISAEAGLGLSPESASRESPLLNDAKEEAKKILTGADIAIDGATTVKGVRDVLIYSLNSDGFSAEDKTKMDGFYWTMNSKGANLAVTYPAVVDSGAAGPAPEVDSGAAAGGGGSTSADTGGQGSTPSGTRTLPKYSLIRGDGPNTGNTDDLTGNGAAVYVINERGERFHVTEQMANELKANGDWYEPNIHPQAEVDAMAMRYTVNSMSDLATINNGTYGAGGFMLMRGDGGPLDNGTLIGNGNAVYAVDNKGNKFHVTESAFNELVSENGGTPPTVGILTQSAVDTGSIDGSLNSGAGTVTADTDPSLMDEAVRRAIAIIDDKPSTNPIPSVAVDIPPVPAGAPAPPPPPADEAMGVQLSAEGTGQFRLVIGSDGDLALPDTELYNNGRAVFVVNASGQKFHVTGQLADAMKANGTWREPEQISIAEVNSMPNGSTVSLTNLDQLRIINIAAGSEFRLIRGNGANANSEQVLEGNGAAVYVLTANGDRYHVTAELANKIQASGVMNSVEVLNQQEVDSMGTMKGSLTTVTQLNAAVKNPGSLGAGGSVTDSSMPAAPPVIVGFTPLGP